MAIWECIPWLPGFIGKMRRNENDFFLSCMKKVSFFHSPAVVRKGTILHNFFSLNIDDHRSVHHFFMMKKSPGGQKILTILHKFFFSLNIDFDHRSVHLGWFI